MIDSVARYDRNIRAFGKGGQDAISTTSVSIVGAGGLGSAVIQQLAFLGVGSITIIDHDELEETNKNRLIGARETDAIPGTLKVDIAERLVRETNTKIEVKTIAKSLVTLEAFDAIKSNQWVFGCLDGDGPRSILNELCLAYGINYIDLASDIPEPGCFGGRICIIGSDEGRGCLECLGEIDRKEVDRYLASPDDQAAINQIYGVPRQQLDDTGPSVVSLNATIASLGVTEFMIAVTGIASEKKHINYSGHLRNLTYRQPKNSCYICDSVRGRKEKADVERFLKVPHLG